MGNIDHKKYVENGIIIYLNESNKYVVEKKKSALNKKEIKKKLFAKYENALEYSNQLIEKKEWKGIVRYNRGLGIEYKNIKITAQKKQEAQIEAENLAKNILGDYIIEVRVIEIH